MATNASRAKEKALKIQQENDPDFVAPKKEKDPAKLVEAAIKSIAKGSGVQFSRMKDKSKELRPVLPTGIFGLDHFLIGSGGFPRGRIVELFGVECLDGDTFINYTVRNSSGKSQNSKGGTIRRLYERFAGIHEGQGKYKRPQTEGSYFTVPSMREDGRIIHNRVLAVHGGSVKPCIKINTAAGNSIITSLTHKFFIGDKWVPASDLSVGGTVYQHNFTRVKADPDKAYKDERKEVYVKFHPYGSVKKITGKVWPGHGTYTYKRMHKSRLVFEADLNGIPYDDFIARLNVGNLDGLTFISTDFHVHHNDEDYNNDDPRNLSLHNAVEHGKLHGPRLAENGRPIVVRDTIVSITDAGDRPTFDLICDEPFNNYIANKLVVHNSGGKGTLISQLIANTQRLNPSDEIAYVDAEAAFDHAYAAKLGVDTDNLLIAEPDAGEDALQAALDMVTTGGVKLVVIDSVAALVPRAELEGEVSDQHMGRQAAMMGRALRKMIGATSKTGTCVAFLNQLRATMNTGFGAKNDTPGGRALKFFSSLRLSVDRIEAYKERGEVVGAVTLLKTPKNKTHMPKLETKFNLMYDMPAQQPGFDSHMSLVDLALTNGIWTQEGSKYNLASTGETVTGKANLRDALRDNKEIRKITEEATLVAMGKSPAYVKRALRG